MLLSYVELRELVERGVITGVKEEAINGASIDVHLGPTIRIEVFPRKGEGLTREAVVDLMARETIQTKEKDIRECPYDVSPGEFILASTIEMFNLPADISCQFLLKSTIGRAGLNHMTATWGDATWHSANLTLELKNDTRYHYLQIREGLPIGQMKFYRHTPVPEHASYARRGRYNGDRGPIPGKL